MSEGPMTSLRSRATSSTPLWTSRFEDDPCRPEILSRRKPPSIHRPPRERRGLPPPVWSLLDDGMASGGDVLRLLVAVFRRSGLPGVVIRDHRTPPLVLALITKSALVVTHAYKMHFVVICDY